VVVYVHFLQWFCYDLFMWVQKSWIFCVKKLLTLFNSYSYTLFQTSCFGKRRKIDLFVVACKNVNTTLLFLRLGLKVLLFPVYLSLRAKLSSRLHTKYIVFFLESVTETADYLSLILQQFIIRHKAQNHSFLRNEANSKRRRSIRAWKKKGFVIPTKSFVKIGIAKNMCYNNKMFSSIKKTFGCCSKFFC